MSLDDPEVVRTDYHAPDVELALVERAQACLTRCSGRRTP